MLRTPWVYHDTKIFGVAALRAPLTLGPLPKCSEGEGFIKYCMTWIILSVVIWCGIVMYQKHRHHRSQLNQQLLEQIRSTPSPTKTHWEAWEDDYMGRD